MTEIKTTEIDDERFWLTCYITYKIFLLVCLVALVMAGAGCTNSGTDGGNCSRTSNCPTDAGQMTTDAGQTNHDTNTDAGTTPDASSNACAAYAGVPSDGWQCSNGGPNYDINNVVMVEENGTCKLHSQQMWCQNTPPATDVAAGQFTCTNTNGFSVTCWHN